MHATKHVLLYCVLRATTHVLRGPWYLPPASTTCSHARATVLGATTHLAPPTKHLPEATSFTPEPSSRLPGPVTPPVSPKSRPAKPWAPPRARWVGPVDRTADRRRSWTLASRTCYNPARYEEFHHDPTRNPGAKVPDDALRTRGFLSAGNIRLSIFREWVASARFFK